VTSLIIDKLCSSANLIVLKFIVLRAYYFTYARGLINLNYVDWCYFNILCFSESEKYL
jgi:hypothetical protein